MFFQKKRKKLKTQLGSRWDPKWVRFPMVSLEFFSDTILPVALWP